MTLYDSQKGLNVIHRVVSKPDLTVGGSQYYARSELVQGAANGFDAHTEQSAVFGRSAGGAAAGFGGNR